MKITRLKQGYRIDLTDAEMEALRHLVDHGQSAMDGEDQYRMLSPSAQRAIKGRFSLFSAMDMDEDRRH